MASSTPSARPSYLQHQNSTAGTTPSSSTASSVFQSSSSLPSLVMPSVNHPTSRQAPLPSPSSQQPSSRQYGSFHPSSHQQPQRPLATNSYEYAPDRSGAGRTATETSHFLREYSLVAEAAKRAQMAVLARDMESMEM